MKKRIQKAVGKTLPFLALSLFLVFLLSWTFVPYTRENVARHDFTGYTAGIKNNALQQEYPDDFLHLVWQPTDEETAEILTFLRQLRPVQTDDFNQSAGLYVPTSLDPEGVILFNGQQLYRLCEAGKTYKHQPLLIIYKFSIKDQTLNFKESVYYASSQDVSVFMDKLADIRVSSADYPYSPATRFPVGG